MGFFGVGVTEGALARATAGISQELSERVEQHQGFIRLRMSYVPGEGESLIPNERSPQEELAYLTRIAYFILEDGAAFALFCPAGELLTQDTGVWRIYDRAFGESENMWRLWIGARPSVLEDGRRLIKLCGLSTLGLTDQALIYDPMSLDLDQAKRAARHLIDQLARDPNLSVFEDRKNRRWRLTEGDEGVTNEFWQEDHGQ